MSKQKSPPVMNLSWGEIVVAGGRTFKDAKLFPGGSREWDWRETGTSHKPGIQIADVEELLDAGAKIVILSTGMWNYLQVVPETMHRLEKIGIIFHVLQTDEAVKLYNELCVSQLVGALIHSTC